MSFISWFGNKNSGVTNGLEGLLSKIERFGTPDLSLFQPL